jgi:hypothetical protein
MHSATGKHSKADYKTCEEGHQLLQGGVWKMCGSAAYEKLSLLCLSGTLKFQQ